jgi:hypothetical protein
MIITATYFCTTIFSNYYKYKNYFAIYTSPCSPEAGTTPMLLKGP